MTSNDTEWEFWMLGQLEDGCLTGETVYITQFEIEGYDVLVCAHRGNVHVVVQ